MVDRNENRKKMSSIPTFFYVGLLTAVLSGCQAPTPPKNAPICPPGSAPLLEERFPVKVGCEQQDGLTLYAQQKPAQSVPRARAEFSGTDLDIPPVFIGVSISGGGSRAAVFGMAVLERLHNLGILQNVSAISTTSGGGLAGAYYAIHGQNINWSNAHDLMAIDYQSPWIKASLNPTSLWSQFTTTKDRADVMNEILDQELFDRLTYSDLGPFVPGKAPIWLANATRLEGTERFTFSTKSFDRIHSDLAQFPISSAVTASAAFPGAFNSMTLFDYRLRIKDAVPAIRNEDSYIHLIDGGPTDNLGIEALLELAKSHARQVLRPEDGNQSRQDSRQGICMLIVVDAYTPGLKGKYSSRDDLRGFVGRFVDLNFFDAIDAMLLGRRNDLLGYLGLGSGTYRPLFSPRFVYFDSPVVSSSIGAGHRVQPESLGNVPEIYLSRKPSEIAEVTPIPDRSMRCAVWHINLSGTKNIQHSPDLQDERGPDSLVDRKERVKLDNLVSQISTNFRLKGPERCSDKLLRDALHEAADILVYEDKFSRQAACEWLTTHGLDKHGVCKAPRTRQAKAADINAQLMFSDKPVAGWTETMRLECK